MAVLCNSYFHLLTLFYINWMFLLFYLEQNFNRMKNIYKIYLDTNTWIELQTV